MSEEKKPTIWQIWTDKSKRTEWQKGYVDGFPLGILVGIQFGVAFSIFIEWLVKR